VVVVGGSTYSKKVVGGPSALIGLSVVVTLVVVVVVVVVEVVALFRVVDVKSYKPSGIPSGL
jgi:hypothetical protein